MPAVKGSGRWQTAILTSLDGQPRLAREVITELVGRPPTEAEYNACHRAMRQLVSRAQLLSWFQPGQRPGARLLVVRRVDRWVSDHDGGTLTEQQRAGDPLRLFTDRAWAAFGTDVGYAVAIAEAAAALAQQEQRDPRSD
jgi:hypothetical protein